MPIGPKETLLRAKATTASQESKTVANNDKDPIWPIVYVYAAYNFVARVARIVIIIIAIWTAVKPSGSILAALLMLLVAGAIRTMNYSDDHRERLR